MINLSTALEISCDTFFYRIGNEFYNRDPGGELFQSYLRQFGFGTAPPVDIPGASPGLVPDQLWREKTYSTPVDQVWDPGYDIDMAIGQGDLLVTPLQLATVAAKMQPHKPQPIATAIGLRRRGSGCWKSRSQRRGSPCRSRLSRFQFLLTS